MSKRWTLKDDKFLFEFHEIGADFVASHDLGHHGKDAGAKRVKLLKERGIWEKLETARRAEIILRAHHTLEFSKSDFFREVAVDSLELIGEPIPAATQGEAAVSPAPMNVSLPDTDERSGEGANAGECPDESLIGTAHLKTSAVEPVSSSTAFYLEDVGSGA